MVGFEIGRGALLPHPPDREASCAEVRGQASGRGLQGVARIVGGHGRRLAEPVDEVGPVADLAPQSVQCLALPSWEVRLTSAQVIDSLGNLLLTHDKAR